MSFKADQITLRRSIDFLMEEEALKDSFLYLKKFIKEAVFISSADKVLIWKTACQESLFKGLHLEFGVHKGASLNCLAQMKPKTTWYGFDSFLGLQENWRGGYYPKHYFSTQGVTPQVESNVKLIKGWFNETLLKFFIKHKGRISLANIDCDTYESTKCVLEHIFPHLIKDSIILLDDYFGYPGWKEGVFKAWQEEVKKHKIKYKYIAFCYRTALVKII
tara:strand:- start:105 stop:761 length:657 start_codon:yes stop_codon:yes gene_type:complete